MTRMIAVPNTGPSGVPVPPRRAISGGSRLRSTPSAIPGSMNPEFSAKSTPAAAVGRLAATRAAGLDLLGAGGEQAAGPSTSLGPGGGRPRPAPDQGARDTHPAA